MALELGTKAPDFKAKTDQDTEISLNSLQGDWVVLYFYPKDNTPGCTKEACAFRDNMERLSDYEAKVIGVSPDSVKSHQNFIAKHELNFTLIADPDKEICNLFDIIGEKKMYGKSYLGVIRTTYIIDPEGIIRWVDPKVSVAGHVDKVIEAIKELQSK